MKKTFELGGNRNPLIRMFVCSTPHLRDLLIRHKEKLVAKCNYVHTWLDTNGYGLCLGYSALQLPDPKAIAEEQARRRTQGALYRNPSYDPLM